LGRGTPHRCTQSIAAGVDDPVALTEKNGIQKHLRMESLDGMKASINMEKATNPYGDLIIAYEMNDEALPRVHGFPLRVIVPGYAAVRNVKWLSKIEISKSEAEGAWQEGLNHKILPAKYDTGCRFQWHRKHGNGWEAKAQAWKNNHMAGRSKLNPGENRMVGHGVEAGATLSVVILLEMAESHGKQHHDDHTHLKQQYSKGILTWSVNFRKRNLINYNIKYRLSE
jgi:hypothetical protein